MDEIRVGDMVRVVGGGGIVTRDKARVMEIRTDVPLGVRLSRPLAGFVFWGVDDLVVVEEDDE